MTRKALLFYFALSSAISFAQTPSSSEREQYARFITSYFAGAKPESGWYKQRGIGKKIEVTKQEIQFLENNSKMIFYQEIIASSLEKGKLSRTCTKTRHIIDFKNIEHVFALGHSLFFEKKYEMALVFRSKGENIRTFTAEINPDDKQNQGENAATPFKSTFQKYGSFVFQYATISNAENIIYDESILNAFKQLIKLNQSEKP